MTNLDQISQPRRLTCHKYIAAFGAEKACIQTMEECGELTTALAHLIRGRKEATDEVIEEVADVALMTDVLRCYLGTMRDSKGRTVDDIIELKYARMFHRAETGNQNAGKE